MKKTMIAFFAACLLSFSLISQNTADFANEKDWTWFGIDYTNCYFIGPIDFPNLTDLESKISAWNELVVVERAKYIEKTLKGRKISYYTDMVKDLNSEIDVKSRLSDDDFKSTHMESPMIQEIVSKYSIPEEMTGVGLVFIAESYSKPNVQGAYYVTFFDIATKKVLSTERMLGKASGFGLRNYWANSYYVVLKAIGKKY